MKTVLKVPFHKKLSFNLLSLVLIVFIFYVGQHILIPLLFAVLLATLLLPVTQFLERRGLNRVFSIVLALAGAIVLITSIAYFLTTQVATLLSDMPTIEKRLGILFMSIKTWVCDNFHVSMKQLNAYVNGTMRDIQDSQTGGIIGKTFFTITGAIPYLFFIPLYTFLILYYKGLIKQFFIDIFENSHEGKVREVLHESLCISQLYSAGLLIEMFIVFALNAAGFYLLGIKYALFMGLLAALLNLIPYIGMITANICCMLITVIACDNMSDVVLVAVVLIVVHLIDNSFIMPLVVGSKVRINALAIIVGVLTGGTLFGIFGMFLAIPGLAVLKVIFDRVDTLQPYGMLLGDYRKPIEQKKASILHALKKVESVK